MKYYFLVLEIVFLLRDEINIFNIKGIFKNDFLFVLKILYFFIYS